MHFDIMGRRGGVRASHFPQVQEMGELPLEKRTASDKLEKATAAEAPAPRPIETRTLSDYMGHHPATIGKTEKPLTIQDNTGGQVAISPPG